jgi:3-oxoacid CoA-transferase
MDLLSGKGDLIIVMEHSDSKGRPKLRRKCTYPLTGRGCVDYVVTDLALLRWHDGRFVLDEVAPGFTPFGVASFSSKSNRFVGRLCPQASSRR